MALKDKRLEAMRQLTKPSVKVEEPNTGEVYLLIDDETNQCLGVYSTEALADDAQDEFWSAYRCITSIECMIMDEDLFKKYQVPSSAV